MALGRSFSFKEGNSAVANAKVDTASMKGICRERKTMGIPSPQQNMNRWSCSRVPRRDAFSEPQQYAAREPEEVNSLQPDEGQMRPTTWLEAEEIQSPLKRLSPP